MSDEQRRLCLDKSRIQYEAPEPKNNKGNNFSKGAKWSPDGSVALVANDDSALRLYGITAHEMSRPQDDETVALGDTVDRLDPYLVVQEGGPIKDFCFYPGFRADDPSTCFFITCSHDHPVHLMDAFEGKLRNTYRPFNHVDEVCHASSLCWSLDGSKILAGFQQYIRVFDVQRPGRQVSDWILSTKKGRGQKGILGSLTSSAYDPGLYAAGSYNRSICLYEEKSKGRPLLWLQDNTRDYEMGGVTHLEWGTSEWMLISGHRQDSWMRVWDIRMASGEIEQNCEQLPRGLLHRFARVTRTHQRFLCSVDRTTQTLITGDESGAVHAYCLASLQEVGTIQSAHSRPCVSAALRPGAPKQLLTSSGGRVFPNFDVPSDSEDSAVEPSVKRCRGDQRESLDNTVRVWDLEWTGLGDIAPGKGGSV